MKLITVKRNGYLDYVIGILLLFIPVVLKLQPHSIQSLLFYIYGIFTIFLSLNTDYKAGLYKVLSSEAHFFIEIIAGLFFMLSPWVFGFVSKTYLPHLCLGGLIVLLSIGARIGSKKFSR